MTRIAKALFAIFVMVRDAAGNVARCGVSAVRQNWERQLAAAGCPRRHAADVWDKVNSVLHGCQQAARIVESVCARSDTQCAGPVIARRVIIVVVASGPSCAMCVCVYRSTMQAATNRKSRVRMNRRFNCVLMQMCVHGS